MKEVNFTIHVTAWRDGNIDVPDDIAEGENTTLREYIIKHILESRLGLWDVSVEDADAGSVMINEVRE